MSDLRQYRCPWCGAETALVATALNCPACGTSVDVQLLTDDAGWCELPPLRDMARLQIGRSFCQIEGTYVPVADFNLAAEDRVYFRPQVLLWKDIPVQLKGMPLAGAWRRFFAGLPVIMAQAHGPGHVAFSQDAPGELIALPLDAGQCIDVREGAFLVATGEIHYDWFSPDVWYQTSQRTHYPIGRYMDRFRAVDRHGLLLLHGRGNVFVRRLDGQQTLYLKPPSLIFKEPDVSMSICIEHPGGFNRVWRRRYVWLRLSGMGRVAIQSEFPHWEDPPQPVYRLSTGSRMIQW
jgi:uncharacterized protein (AIM24 family)